MCGIVGFTGKDQVLSKIIDGLKRLEYRGYDSAGVSLHAENRLEVVKQAGKITELHSSAAHLSQLKSRSGIGHTRWATHGEANSVNAHPHLSSDRMIAVVHNGIIENHLQIRRVLENEGVVMQSETDSEVLAHLISRYYHNGNLLEAVSSALHHVEGAYGLAVMAADKPGVIVGAKNGSPLVIGLGENENLIASDVAALIAYTERVIYLEDGELVEISADEFHTYNLNNIEIDKQVEQIEIEINQIEKNGFPHLMLKEIHEQVRTIEDCYRGRLVPGQGAVKLGGLDSIMDRLTDFERITITACGTSWHAGLIGEYLIEELAGIPVEVEYASEFRYRNPVLDKKTLVIVISQSGETADTLAALREAKLRGSTVMGICNGIGSSIARETDCGIFIHAGLEVSVASTKAFTSQVTALFLFAVMLGRTRNLSITRANELIDSLQQIPQLVAQILESSDQIRTIAQLFMNKRNFLFLGRGVNFPVALEGALKLKEISYIHAEGYPAAEMKHGPIALIDENMPVVVIAPRQGMYEKIFSNIHEIRTRKGRIIAVVDEDDNEIQQLAEHVIRIPKINELLSPLLTVVPLQLISYYIAAERGCNVDQPRNLAKSVTVE